MDFMTAVKHVFSNYATFSGRARRSEYWWWVLFNFAVSIVLGWIPIIGFIIMLGLLIPSIAVAVRRMHDTGRSGWWILLPAVPGVLLGATTGASLANGAAPGILGIILGLAYLAAIILILVWFVQRGTVGPNQFGEDPYDAPPAG